MSIERTNEKALMSTIQSNAVPTIARANEKNTVPESSTITPSSHAGLLKFILVLLTLGGAIVFSASRSGIDLRSLQNNPLDVFPVLISGLITLGPFILMAVVAVRLMRSVKSHSAVFKEVREIFKILAYKQTDPAEREKSIAQIIEKMDLKKYKDRSSR